MDKLIVPLLMVAVGTLTLLFGHIFDREVYLLIGNMWLLGTVLQISISDNATFYVTLREHVTPSAKPTDEV